MFLFPSKFDIRQLRSPVSLSAVVGLFLFVAFFSSPALASQVDLAWSDNSNNETGFRIERALSTGSFAQIATTGTNARTYTDTGVAANTSYQYRVLAYNSVGSSAYSNTVTATIPAGTPANTAPTIGTITNRTINEDTNTGAIAVTVSDAQTSAASLTLTGSSSNTALVPAGNIAFGGSAGNRTITVTPAANQSGTATITANVSDGSLAATAAFTVTVSAVNDTPTISNITDRSSVVGTAQAAIAFTVGDAETATASLQVTATSSNLALLPSTGLVLGGSGANRTLALTPLAGVLGSTTVTVRASDGSLSATDTFVVSITGSTTNTAPTISAITSRTINEDTNTGAIAVTVSDAQTSGASLQLTGTSSNATLVPAGNITFGGSAGNRTITVTPAANQSGTATITARVSDGSLAATAAFTVTVSAVNDTPTISNITDRSSVVGTAQAAIAFTVGDAETAAASLQVTATSSNLALLPSTGLVLGGSGANRTLALTPLAGVVGATTVTVRASDGSLSATDTFVVTMTAATANTAPTISAIADRTIPVDGTTGAISFAVGDTQTPVANLTVTRTSSDLTLVPLANVTFGGSGANRTVTVKPAATRTGSSTITITVSDGTLSLAEVFVVTVSGASTMTWADVGSPAIAGSHVTTGGSMQVRAGGAAPTLKSDQFHFGYTSMPGDAELTVRVASLTNANAATSAGLMFRASSAANAAQVSVFATPGYGVLMIYRSTTGASYNYTASVAATAPQWLRLMRTGNTFYAFTSEDGSDWDLVESVTVTLPATALGGLAVTSQNARTATTAVFDNFVAD